MTRPTYGDLIAEPLTDVERIFASSIISATNKDGTAFCVPVCPSPTTGGVFPTVSAPLVPKGYQQIITVGAASALIVPAGAVYALFTAEHDTRWRDDGVDPTSAVGMPFYGSWSMWYIGDLAAFRIIGFLVGAIVDVLYYGTT